MGSYGPQVMQELFAEVGTELVPFLFRAVGAVVLALAGTFVEFNAISTLLSGDLLLGGWLLYVGALALYAGLFVLGPDALAELSDEDGEADAA